MKRASEERRRELSFQLTNPEAMYVYVWTYELYSSLASWLQTPQRCVW